MFRQKPKNKDSTEERKPQKKDSSDTDSTDSFEEQPFIAAMNMPQYVHIQRNHLQHLKNWYRRFHYYEYGKDFCWEALDSA